MEKRPTVYFSNQIEKLAELLGLALFQKGADPFVKKTILLPHHNLKSYLTTFFAKHWHICMGVECKTLVEGSMENFEGDTFPSIMALSFAIEQELWQIHEEKESCFADLLPYLISDQSRRITWISQELAFLFHSYAVFEPKALQAWLDQGGWKQEIWERVFCKQKGWSILSEKMGEKKQIHGEIHAFGFAHMPPHFYDFFSLSTTSFYFLSPCEMFWEDLCSDKERIYLEKKMVGKKVQLQVQEQLSFLLKKTHPLLGNLGGLGRDLLRRFGETETYIKEEYVEQEASTLLATIQNSLLHLEDERMQREVFKEDVSLLCLSTTSPLREVEVLLQTLKELIIRWSLQPKDVLVLSFDLEAYLPYIHAVFGAASCSLDYTIHGIPADSEETRSIKAFLSLAQSRFELDPVMDFFSLPLVLQQFALQKSDINLLRTLFQKAGVLWGLSPMHKMHCLKKTSPQEGLFASSQKKGSWAEGIRRLVLGLAIDPKEMLGEEQPLPLLEWSQAEILGRWIQGMEALEKDMEPIYEEQKKTVKEWICFIKRVLATYFGLDEKENSLLQSLAFLDAELGDRSIILPFSSFSRVIEDFFQKKKESFQSSHLNAIKFLQAEQGCCYPTAVLYVLGCDEESFPSKENVSCFANKKKEKEIPSLGDLERYFILELILQARCSLVFSYQRIGRKDQKPQGYSRLLEEVWSYVDNHFICQPHEKTSLTFTRDHPSIPFSFEYFLQESYQTEYFPLAMKHYAQAKTQISPFFPFWQGKKGLIPKEWPEAIDIKQLEDFVKNPVKSYMQNCLGIFFDFEPPKDREFFISPLARQQIEQRAKLALLQEEDLSSWLKKEIPEGLFGQIGFMDLQESLRNWKENLKVFGLTQEDLFFIEFKKEARILHLEKGKMILPALTLEFEGKNIKIQGILSLASQKGFLWFGKKKKQDYPLLLPSFLLFLSVAEDLGLPPKCLLVEEGKEILFPIKTPKKWLKEFVLLYLQGIKEPCPVRPEWILPLLSKDKEALQKKLAPSLFDFGFKDPYQAWIEARDPLVSAGYLQDRWEESYRKAFSCLIDSAEEEIDDL